MKKDDSKLVNGRAGDERGRRERILDEALSTSGVDRHPDQETPAPEIRGPHDSRVVLSQEDDEGNETILRLL